MRSSLCVEAAVNRMGVILASSDVMDYEVTMGRLERVSDISIRRGSYHLVYGEGAVRRRTVRIFRDWLLDASTELRSADL
jgi:DNA-binding transcriptional LysR family regulator